MMNKLHFLYRSFSTCDVARGKIGAKQARVMNKILGGSSKKRSWFPAKEVSATSLPHIVQPKRGERNSRRISVLNKLFMKYISDIFTSGELTPETTLLKFDISKVKISPDFSILKVYWVAKGTIDDGKVESVLLNHRGKLRHELTQLRVIGNVPAIVFVRDNSLCKVAEVDAVLANADFGDDFVPTDPYSLLSNFALSSKLPQHLEEKILSQDGLPETPVPIMRSDAVGLEHDVIMQKIRLAMNKAKAPHRSPLAIHTRNEEMHSDEETRLSSLKDADSHEGHENEINIQRSDLKKFFAKRIASQSKVLKIPKNYEPGREILLTQEDSLDDEEGFDDFDVMTNSLRIKELDIDVDDFTKIEGDIKSLLVEDEKNN